MKHEGGAPILRREIRQLRRDLRKADLHNTTEMFRASRREVKVARSELKDELLKLNNLRQEVTSDRGLLVTKDTLNAELGRIEDTLRLEIKTLGDKVNINTRSADRSEAAGAGAAAFRARIDSNITLILLVVAIIAGLVGHFL
jgi:hypothetical protein